MKFNDFKICIELPIKAHKANLKYVSTPSYERKRIGGKRRFNLFRWSSNTVWNGLFIFNKVYEEYFYWGPFIDNKIATVKAIYNSALGIVIQIVLEQNYK